MRSSPPARRPSTRRPRCRRSRRASPARRGRGVSQWSGATRWCGATPSCGAIRWCGATPSCGATPWSGATRSSGGTPSCGGMSTTPSDWREGLPDLPGERLTLRELRPCDAESLYAELTSPEVRRFMWAPPPNAGAFAQFIDWAHTERATGKYVCYGIVPRGETDAAGVFELRQLQPGFFRGELGFVMASRLWGRGVFPEGARLILDFAFRTIKVHRIEARAA